MKARTSRLPAAAALTALLFNAAACAPPQQGAPTPTAATAGPTSATAPASPAESAALQTFTFPDRHISFTCPGQWRVQLRPGPALSAEARKISFEAVISDAAGKEVARVYSGAYGDGASGPAKRTVLDHVPLPGITDTTGGPAEFGFGYDEYPGPGGSPYYFMDVRSAKEFLATTNSSGTNQLSLPNGIMAARVTLGDQSRRPAFASPAAAIAWMGTAHYAQLRAMLLSLKYS